MIWPVPDSHEMSFGFAAGAPGNIYKFHEGIDIRASGNGGENVVAARGGTVLWRNPTYVGGMVTIEVDVGEGAKEFDEYLHVSDIVAPAPGMTMATGDAIGKISSTFRPAGSRHLHFEVHDAAPPSNEIAPENTYLNPFLRFHANTDKDPLGNSPELRDTNNDNKTLLVTESGDPAAVFSKQPVKGDLDLIADVVDSMSTDFDFMTNPYKVGYLVKPIVKDSHGVKSDALGNPYLLAKFDDTWFDGWTAGGVTRPTSEKFGEVYDTSRPADTGTFPSVVLDHFIVTNTKGEDGAIGNVDGNQYWNTNAKNDGSDNNSAHANFAGKPDAAKNADARFRDGAYVVHIVLSDLLHSEIVNAGKLLLDNFDQVSAPKRGGAPSPGGSPIMLYDPDPTPYVPDLIPEPSIADVSFRFDLDEVVGVWGDEYYPDFLMTAYIVPHREEGWMQDDPLADNAIATIIVQSDSLGVVPDTEAWVADQIGTFDIIIDYDNDGLFSWTLDGLSGFHVCGCMVYGEGTLTPDGSNIVVTMGVPDRGELDGQPMGYHGATIGLNPAASYEITFDFDLKTWDSYNEDTGPGTGYWDSFSVSVTDRPYPDLELTDPVSFPFLWGGTVWGDEILDIHSGTLTLTFAGNPDGPNFLNIVLDTATPPTEDDLYPSWGTITITSELDTCDDIVPMGGGESFAGGSGGDSFSSLGELGGRSNAFLQFVGASDSGEGESALASEPEAAMFVLAGATEDAAAKSRAPAGPSFVDVTLLDPSPSPGAHREFLVAGPPRPGVEAEELGPAVDDRADTPDAFDALDEFFAHLDGQEE